MNKKIIKTTTKELNQFFTMKEELNYYDWILSIGYNKKDDVFEFNAESELDYDNVTITILNTKELTTYMLLKNIISEVYENEINDRNRIIKNYNNFLRRKAKSLALWSGRNNTVKVNGIVTEISEMNKEVETAKSEVTTYKEIVQLLFDSIDTFAKDEKIQIAQQKCEERIKQLQKLKNTGDVIFVR